MKDRVCVGAVLIRAVDHGRDESAPVLLGRRAANREFYPDVWDVLGGHLEPGETSEQALAPHPTRRSCAGRLEDRSVAARRAP